VRRAGLLLALVLAGCGGDRPAVESPTGDAAVRARGKALLAAYGCVACHSMRGFQTAGAAGPPLESIARNSYIAGILPNNPDAMARWIAAPRSISPCTAMPDLGVRADEARAMASYLYGQ
jgi:cytochrome c